MANKCKAGWPVLLASLFFLSACEGSRAESEGVSVFDECKQQWGSLPSAKLQHSFEDLLREHRDADAYILVRAGMADYGYFDGLFVAMKDDRAFLIKSKGGDLVEESLNVSAELESNFLKLKQGIVSESYTRSTKIGLHTTCKFIDAKVDEVELSFETTYSPAWMDDYMIKDLNVELSPFDEALHYFLNIK